MNTIAQELKAFGFEGSSRIRLSQELGEASSGKLRNLFTNVWNDISVLTVNDRVNRMIIRYAIVDAINSGQDALTAEIIENAKNKADSLANTMGTFKIQEGELEGEEGEERSERASNGVKRTRNPDLFPRIKNLVALSPDATKNEIIERVLKELDTNEGTATMYFYKARKELGLKNNGKRGRKPKA